MQGKALVIGATGLLGYSATIELSNSGWNVRAIGKEYLTSTSFFTSNVEYLAGDFYDEGFLCSALKGIDKVFFFLSSTFPSTSVDSLELEISRTMKGLDYLLRKMRECEVLEIVFPSSGGTVYGNYESGKACEEDILNPVTPYGLGKKMCEEVLRFYSQFGISATILRIGNVYGSSLVRTTAQGVIDLFVQKAIEGEAVSVWGDALSNVRDYIFEDDFARAVARIAEHKANGVEVYNLSSGVGTTLQEIINIINRYSVEPLKITHVYSDATASIKRIVLDVDKFRRKTGWIASFDIESGIAATFERKKSNKRII